MHAKRANWYTDGTLATAISLCPQKIGRALYEEFTMVMILNEQMRVIDDEWANFLRKLRFDNASRTDIDMLFGRYKYHQPPYKPSYYLQVS